jgi:HAD superfamily hydrolase (TIGR01490 family)
MGIAFVDMDKTLLRGSSGVLYVRHLWSKRLVSFKELMSTFIISVQYTMNMMNFTSAMARISQRIKDGDAIATQQLCDAWFADELVHYIAPKAVARIREHEQQGDIPILLSASTQFAVAPVANYLGIAFRCTELEVINNKMTGEIIGMHCYGEGKRYWGERLAQEHDVPLADCTFYTDSYSDRPLLDVVGHPVAVNPDRKLAALARENSWTIERFY